MRYRKKTQLSEALVVFELCYVLRTEGIAFDLEYTDRVIDWNFGQKKVRFDIVIIHNDLIVCIIECKREKKLLARDNQIAKYSTFGVPVLLCRGLVDIPATVAKIQSLLRSTRETE